MNKKELLALAGSVCSKPGGPVCGCATPPVTDQFQFSQARFNDTSAQTSASMQQTFAQQQAAWGAHLLKIQHDITQIAPPSA